MVSLIYTYVDSFVCPFFLSVSIFSSSISRLFVCPHVSYFTFCPHFLLLWLVWMWWCPRSRVSKQLKPFEEISRWPNSQRSSQSPQTRSRKTEISVFLLEWTGAWYHFVSVSVVLKLFPITELLRSQFERRNSQQFFKRFEHFPLHLLGAFCSSVSR